MRSEKHTSLPHLVAVKGLPYCQAGRKPGWHRGEICQARHAYLLRLHPDQHEMTNALGFLKAVGFERYTARTCL